MYISTHSDWTSNLLNVGFFCQDFFSLLAEALDLGLGELLALVQLLDPLVQLLGEQLLVHDAARPNRLPLRAAPAPPPAPGPHAHAAAALPGCFLRPQAAAGRWRRPAGSLRSARPPAAVPPPCFLEVLWFTLRGTSPERVLLSTPAAAGGASLCPPASQTGRALYQVLHVRESLLDTLPLPSPNPTLS